jgi:hypothetical protein
MLEDKPGQNQNKKGATMSCYPIINWTGLCPSTVEGQNPVCKVSSRALHQERSGNLPVSHYGFTVGESPDADTPNAL